MNEPTLHILTTCTKRKRLPVASALQFRRVKGRTIEQIAAQWTESLGSATSPVASAEQLYVGDQWQIACELPRVARSRSICARLWVCSAGYGLIPSTATLHGYSATFSSGHPDSVHRRLGDRRSEVLSIWWNEIARWSGPAPGEPRTIAELSHRFPNVPLLVVASPAYLQAIKDDLELSRQALADPELLMIISAGSGVGGVFSRHILPCDSRLQTVLGGSLMSLNARVARRLLENAEPDALVYTQLRKKLDALMEGRVRGLPLLRKPVTDAGIERFILKAYFKNPHVTHSNLLRKLRDSGRACEQKRFRRIFEHVTEVTRDR